MMPRGRTIMRRGRDEPLIGLIGNGDISISVGFVVSALSYYALMRGRIGALAAAQAGPADGPASQARRDVGAVAVPGAEET